MFNRKQKTASFFVYILFLGKVIYYGLRPLRSSASNIILNFIRLVDNITAEQACQYFIQLIESRCLS